ncbi:MAG: ribonuclease Z [Cytophagaceae bacterium]|nr:ribonuclease Z [Cytophagaceae bacterium]
MVFSVSILGSGSATPTVLRHATAQLLCYDTDCYLIDCGENTQVQLLRYKFRPGRLKYIFISHLHGDHYFGLIGLLTSLSLAQRHDDLWLFGPPGLGDIITLQLKYSDSRLNYPLHFQEIETGQAYPILDTPALTVEAIPLQHRIHTSGYLFREKPQLRKLIKEILPPDLPHDALRQLKEGRDVTLPDGQMLASDVFTRPAPPPRSYAFCSDTLYHAELAERVQGVDLLYHEATFLHELHERAAQTFHSTARQAAQLARLAGVGRLMIGHYSSRYKDLTPLLDEARAVFPATVLAIEGETIDVRKMG